MHRFFASPEVLAQDPVVLTGSQARQIRQVLRLRLGERVMLLDGTGEAAEAMLIALDARCARFRVERRCRADGEPSVHITLHQAVLKGERFAWALQKGAEVGVGRFAPIVCERSIVDDLGAIQGKYGRWRRIIQEAAEQSGRALLPELMPAQLFSNAVASAAPALVNGAGPERTPPGEGATAPIRLMAWEEEQALRLSDALRDCNLAPGARIEVFIGPEGGFTQREVDLARSFGLARVSLGRRLLRAETAGVVAATAILCAVRDL